MRKLVSTTIAAAIVSISMISSASAGEGHIMGPNGRLTYWNDGQPGYVVVVPQYQRRTVIVQRRSNLGDLLGAYTALKIIDTIDNGIARLNQQQSDNALINACLKANRSPVREANGTLACY